MTIASSLRGPRGTLALFVLLGSLWGTSFVAIEIGLETFPPLSFAGIRYLLAGVLLFGFVAARRTRWWPRTRNDWISIGVLAAFIIFGNHAFLYLGEQYVSGAVAAVIISLSPVLTVFFASVALGHGVPRVHEFVGFALGIAGVVVIAQPDPSSLGGDSLLGVALVLLAAIAFALGGVLSRPFRTDLPVETLQSWSMIGGAGMLLLGGRLRGEEVSAIEPTFTGLLALGHLTLLSGVVAFLVYFTLLDRVGPSQLNLVGYLEPIAAALTSWVILGHGVEPATGAGFALIALGFVFIQRDHLARLLDARLPRVSRGLSRATTWSRVLQEEVRHGYRLPDPSTKR
ncbi:MAG: DMT family transporter [Halodesulfurarchaeum sp.]